MAYFSEVAFALVTSFSNPAIRLFSAQHWFVRMNWKETTLFIQELSLIGV